MSRHTGISECSITNPQESRHRHPHPSMNYFFCPVTVCIDIWLRLSSYKQLVFHIYLHRFNILKIVTFNKLPCFVQPKSSNASVFFFLFETPVEINTWLLSFHQMHHTSLSPSSPQISLLSEKKFLASVMSSLSIELSAVSHVAARYRATLCFAVDTLSPKYQHRRYSQTNTLIAVYVCTRQPVTHWPHYPRSNDENMTSEWHYSKLQVAHSLFLFISAD